MPSPTENAKDVEVNEDSIEIDLSEHSRELPLQKLYDGRPRNERQEGKVLVPALLWMAGVPFGVVLLLWFFFFRG
jgi:hypothetical protein